MFQNFIIFLFLKFKVLELYEYQFIKKMKIQKLNYQKKNFKTIVSMSPDYFHLAQTACLLKSKYFGSNKIIGVWSTFYTNLDRGNFLLEKIIYLKKILIDYFLRIKWTMLYKAIGVNTIINLKNFDFLGLEYLCSKKNIYDLSYNKIRKEKINGIPIYENIIDSYIRFRNKPSVDYNDYYLKEILIKLRNLKKNFQKHFKDCQKRSFLILNYSNYHLGVLAKTAISLGMNVYTTRDASSYLKKLSKKDYATNMLCKNFKKKFSFIPNKKPKLKFARNELNKKFLGKKEVALYQIFRSSYFRSKKKLSGTLDGVLFLHNFFDSPHHIKSLMFEDFYDWAQFTLKIISKHNLNIAIKPHPTNTIYGSRELMCKLKMQFPNLKWIKPNTSNLEIIKKIKFGISCYGSILYELPYKNIPSIAGTKHHPSSEYNFVFTPKNKKHYEHLILNSSKLKMKRNVKRQIEEFYYMFCIHNNDAIKNIGRKLNLKSIDFNNSKGLLVFYNRLKNFKIYEKNKKSY